MSGLREQVKDAITDVWDSGYREIPIDEATDAVMAVVAPILTAALDEVQRLAAARLVLAVFGTPDDAPQPFSICRDKEVVGLGVQWPGDAVTIKWTPPDRLATVTSTSLADALAVADFPDGTLGVVWLSEDLGTLAEAEERAIRAEADLAAARQQLDQVRDGVRRLPSYEHSLDGHAYVRLADLLAILDAPARTGVAEVNPAGHDESRQST